MPGPTIANNFPGVQGGRTTSQIQLDEPGDAYGKQFVTTDLVIPVATAAVIYYLSRNMALTLAGGVGAYVWKVKGRVDENAIINNQLNPATKPSRRFDPIDNKPIPNLGPLPVLHPIGLPDGSFFHARPTPHMV